MIPKIKIEKLIAKEHKRRKEYRKDKTHWFMLGGSTVFHFLMAVILSYAYVEQPKMTMYLPSPVKPRGLDVVFLKYEEPEPVVIFRDKSEKTSPVTKVLIKKETITQKTVPQQVETQPAWQEALLRSRSAGGGSAPGSSGQEGRRGAPGDQPGMRKAGGIVSEDLLTKTGGTGIRSDRIEKNMIIPAGKGSDFGAGGKDTSGFKFGLLEDGRGSGRADIAGRGGSGGSGGLGEKGPGQGLAAGTGKGTGGGSGTGIGIGDGGGKGGMGTGTGQGEGSGGGAGKGIGDGGPGFGGYETGTTRSNPNPETRSASGSGSVTGSPKKAPAGEDKRSAIEREGFKADIGKGMEGPKVEAPKKEDNRNFGEVLQEEINKDLHSLRKLYEDWNNSNISGIPKALQITVVVNKSGNQVTVSSIDFHTTLNSRISDDLTKRIKTWKFKSLVDGVDDPTEWPVKMNGRISWQ